MSQGVAHTHSLRGDTPSIRVRERLRLPSPHSSNSSILAGLHYTVPWSVPVFALTCLKKPKDVVPFELMGDKDDVVDKIYLIDPQTGAQEAFTNIKPFGMKHKEAHIKELKAQFPQEQDAIDAFMRVSNYGMHYVKLFLFARLLPRCLQDVFWFFVPKFITDRWD
jgi:hypothetical protein